MICKGYEYKNDGAVGELQADTMPSEMPETYSGIEGGAGEKVKIAAGSQLLITGTSTVYIKKEMAGWDEL